MNVYKQILTNKEKNKKQIAVLIDPDKAAGKELELLCALAQKAEVDFLFVGGSLLTNGNIHHCIKSIKNCCNIPVVIFPGSTMQIDGNADAILFLSLLSGRNADLLIGKHVMAAPIVKEQKLEAISTGYILIDGGNITTVQYISDTKPIPADKADITACTALAGEMLGMKLIFLEAGSGAHIPVNETTIEKVAQTINIPLIVGGGIRTPEKAMQNFKAGADMIVIGNLFEKHPSLLMEMAATRFEYFSK
ncbi:MAG: geranylgeranylglyceryl/heptaprenylglyceryl phosphate synthase [Bacteroidetes bacterium]|nr:geranylgeranylglyceryl/heptaprenylglyceryl phosphate synthase [Bacteroidota bacterium]HNR20552.1 geranylgeranylglyceryl/heptaprenylglyceryl phosphate synthase [Bacteroidia bacterium]HNU33166.1 geranylgeranylglyceryl/heptaprenylglyceryl phosphate synthase [Bacteroidia bacterium]